MGFVYEDIYNNKANWGRSRRRKKKRLIGDGLCVDFSIILHASWLAPEDCGLTGLDCLFSSFYVMGLYPSHFWFACSRQSFVYKQDESLQFFTGCSHHLLFKFKTESVSQPSRRLRWIAFLIWKLIFQNAFLFRFVLVSSPLFHTCSSAVVSLI